MTEAMPFLRKLILLSYDPRPSDGSFIIMIRPMDLRRPDWRRGFILC